MKNKLIKFILSFTDYDKIKKENESLKSNIATLIEKPYSSDSYVIIESYRMEKQISSIVWMGSIDEFKELECFEGIIKHVTE